MIGYSIDEKWRGVGLGSKLILMGEEMLLRDIGDIQVFKARVKYENIPSTHVFERCSYKKWN